MERKNVLIRQNIYLKQSTWVGDYFITIKTNFLFILKKLFSDYKFTNNQREAFLIDSFS